MGNPRQVLRSWNWTSLISLAFRQSSPCRGDIYCVCVINTADKKLLPQRIRTAIDSIFSPQIYKVFVSETYLTVAGTYSSYSGNKIDLFDISKFQQLAYAKEIFSKPELHINSINQQFNNNSKIKETNINITISQDF
jgi:hypothetical protein